MLRSAFFLLLILTGFCAHAVLVAEEQQFLIDFLQTFTCEFPSGWSVSNLDNACEWQGISCSNDGQHIVNITIIEQKVCFYFPPSVGNLIELEHLEFVHTAGLYTLPNELCNLHKLTTLMLPSNFFDGPIPDCINENNFPHLAHIDLSYNRLSGEIPESIFNLPSLISLNLLRNYLVGTIPQSIGNATNLNYFTVHGNNLSGKIPPVIADLPNIGFIDLSNNNFTCPIGEFINKLVARNSSIWCGLNYNFFERTENGICDEIKYPFPNVCHIVPVLKRDVRCKETPDYIIEEKSILVEIYGGTLYFFAANSAGVPYRGDYIIYDINSWAHTGEWRTLEQVEVTKFSSHTVDTKNRHHTFIANLDNGAQMTVTLTFYDKSAKLGLAISNWDLVEHESTQVSLYQQLTFFSPHSTENETMACTYQDILQTGCYSSLLNITVGIQFETSEFVFNSRSERLEATFGVSGMYYVDKDSSYFAVPNSAVVYLLPYGEITQTRHTGIYPSSLPQAVSGVFEMLFPPWNHSLNWDPDLRLQLLFDFSSSEEDEDTTQGMKIAVGLGIGIGVPLVAAVATVLVIRRHNLMKERVKQSEKVSQAVKRLGEGANEKSEWTASQPPIEIRNTK